MYTKLSPKAEAFAPRNGSTTKTIQELIDELELRLKSEGQGTSKSVDDLKSELTGEKNVTTTQVLYIAQVTAAANTKKPTNPVGYPNLSAELREMILQGYFSDVHMVPKRNRARLHLNPIPNVVKALEKYGDPGLVIEALRVLATYKTFYFSTLQGPANRMSKELVNAPESMAQIYKSKITFTDNDSLLLKSIPSIHQMVSLQELTLVICTPTTLAFIISHLLLGLHSLHKLKIEIRIVGTRRCGFKTKLDFYDAFKPGVKDLNRMLGMKGFVTWKAVDEDGKVGRHQIWVWDSRFKEGDGRGKAFVVGKVLRIWGDIMDL